MRLDKRSVLISVINIILAYLLITFVFTIAIYMLGSSVLYSRLKDTDLSSVYHITGECVIIDYDDMTALLIPPQSPNEGLQILVDEPRIRYEYGVSMDTCIGTIYRTDGSIALNSEEIEKGRVKKGSYMNPNLLNPWLLGEEDYYIENMGRYTCLGIESDDYPGEGWDAEVLRSKSFDFILVKYRCAHKYIFNFPLFFVLILLYFAREKLKEPIDKDAGMIE